MTSIGIEDLAVGERINPEDLQVKKKYHRELIVQRDILAMPNMTTLRRVSSCTIKMSKYFVEATGSRVASVLYTGTKEFSQLLERKDYERFDRILNEVGIM